MSRALDLFAEFALIGATAFGGGQAALPLIEQVSVAKQGWLSHAALSTGVAIAYSMPGPFTLLVAFIGYQAGGLVGALAATGGMFLVPIALSALFAALEEALQHNKWVQAFSSGASPAVVGLLAATVWNLGSHALSSWKTWGIALLALIVVARTRSPLAALFLGGAALGWLFLR